MSGPEFLIQTNRFVKLSKKQNFPENSFANFWAVQERFGINDLNFKIYRWLWSAHINCLSFTVEMSGAPWYSTDLLSVSLANKQREFDQGWGTDWLDLQRKLFYPEAMQDNIASSEKSSVGEFILKFYWNKIQIFSSLLIEIFPRSQQER